MRSRRRSKSVLLSLLIATLAVPAAPAFANPPERVPVHGLDGTQSLQVVRTGTDQGPSDPAAQVTAQVFLAGDSRGLAAYARAVSDPRNPRHGHYLTPEQTRGLFGPAQNRIDAVSEWLRGTGLSIVLAGSRAVVARGTLAQATEAFGTRFHDFSFLDRRYRAAVDPVTVPAALGRDILTVTGLSVVTSSGKPSPGSRAKSRIAARSAAGRAAVAGPCPATFGDTPATDLPPAYGRPAQWAPCGYTPKQIRDAYGITGSGLTGKGVTIGIISTRNEINTLPDANRFATAHGEPPFAPGQFTAYVPADAQRDEASGEFAMDVQAAHAIAPDANIAVVVGSEALYGDKVLDSIVQIVDRHLADVVSGSYVTGWTPDYAPDAISAYERAFQEAAVEGITVDFASGDSGGGTHGGVKTVDYPPSSPWVTAVGGTTLAIGRGNSYLWETGWATDRVSLTEDGRSWDAALPGYQGKASGGGTSTVFPQPFYQQGVVPASFAGTPPMRTLPDVAAPADPDLSLLIGETDYDPDGSLSYKESNGGGTSLSSPIFAGFEALLVQEHGPLGFANPALYARPRSAYHAIRDNPAGTPETVSFAVVNHGFVDLITPGQYADSDLVYAPGYDTITGLGSPTRALLDSFRRPGPHWGPARATG